MTYIEYSLVITLSLTLFLYSCQSQEKMEEKPSSVTLCFDHYYPTSFRTKGGFHKSNYSTVMYADSLGSIQDFTPLWQLDTLTIPCIGKLTEVAIGYHTFEYAYYPLLRGDTLTITMDSIDYPIVRSKHYPEINELYEANHKVRAAYTIETLEAGTILGDADFYRLAINRDLLKKISPDRLYLSSYPIDSVETVFQSYMTDYVNELDILLSDKKIKPELYSHAMSILDYKKEYAHYNERDTAYYHKLESRFSDDLSAFPSYNVFLDYYLQLYTQHIGNIHVSQGSFKDWKLAFDDLEQKSIPTKTKHMLLKKCIGQLTQLFDAETANNYLQKYHHITGDKQLTEKITKQYNLLADKSQLLLHDQKGNKTNFKALMELFIGKVVYVDFWASWCAPCLAQMPYAANLRERNQDKEIVFLYLALNDKEEAWQKASEEEGLDKLDTNFFIENSKTCDLLKELDVRTIPRYLLFDKQGNLVNGNAPRPSSDQIEKEIAQLLN